MCHPVCQTSLMAPEVNVADVCEKVFGKHPCREASVFCLLFMFCFFLMQLAGCCAFWSVILGILSDSVFWVHESIVVYWLLKALLLSVFSCLKPFFYRLYFLLPCSPVYET